jgi:hypothetical protein
MVPEGKTDFASLTVSSGKGMFVQLPVGVGSVAQQFNLIFIK